MPYRISFSHALTNLESLCATCHKKVEAHIKELWGGKSFGGSKRPRIKGYAIKQVCLSCGKMRVLVAGSCESCVNRFKTEIARKLRAQGKTLVEIANVVGLTYQWVSLALRRPPK